MSDEKQVFSQSTVERMQIRHERTVKRFIIALIVMAILIFASNAIWLYAWCQYDYTSETTQSTVNQDGNGYNNYNTGTQGDMNGANNQNDDKNKNSP